MDFGYEAYQAELHQMNVHQLNIWQINIEIETCRRLLAQCVSQNNNGECDNEEHAAPSLESLELRARIQYLEARIIEEAPFSARGQYYWQLTDEELSEELALRRKAIASASPDVYRQYLADIRKIIKEMEIRNRPALADRINDDEK